MCGPDRIRPLAKRPLGEAFGREHARAIETCRRSTLTRSCVWPGQGGAGRGVPAGRAGSATKEMTCTGRLDRAGRLFSAANLIRWSLAGGLLGAGRGAAGRGGGAGGGETPPLPCVPTAFAAEMLPLPCAFPLLPRLRHRLCLVLPPPPSRLRHRLSPATRRRSRQRRPRRRRRSTPPRSWSTGGPS